MVLMRARTGYSRAEQLSDTVVHVLGVVVVSVAVPVLIYGAIHTRGDGFSVTAATVYGLTLTAMIGFSALYNTMGSSRWTGVLRRLDHSAIYAKIAGTYTPFALVQGGEGLWLLSGLWTAALVGITLKVIDPDRLRWFALGLCLAMGWAGLIAGGDFLTTLSPDVVRLIMTGGTIYTIGMAFYLCERLPFHYTIWHVLVLAASMVFYAAVTTQIIAGGATPIATLSPDTPQIAALRISSR